MPKSQPLTPHTSSYNSTLIAHTITQPFHHPTPTPQFLHISPLHPTSITNTSNPPLQLHTWLHITSISILSPNILIPNTQSHPVPLHIHWSPHANACLLLQPLPSTFLLLSTSPSALYYTSPPFTCPPHSSPPPLLPSPLPHCLPPRYILLTPRIQPPCQSHPLYLNLMQPY